MARHSRCSVARRAGARRATESHAITVRLNDQEVARLDEIRGDEERAVQLRWLLHEPPSGNEVATRTEALGVLTRPARDGRTTAAIALAKELRGDEPAFELEEFLRGK